MRTAFSFCFDFLTYKSKRVTQIQCLKEGTGGKFKWALFSLIKDDYIFNVNV